ncbi:MAG: O-acetyl-ADP-ribose deacetylase [candidate division Zixibacteria bacterium]|nr:O-acetyl-ADP-ribose deacetylase [candidate division Zixibacteria bacterium]
MSDQKVINKGTIRLEKVDITDLDIESFVYYARSDLKLGSGFGGAIILRGGQAIQKELDTLAPLELTKAIISDAGNLKAKYIIHANGPKFQEEDLEKKLGETTLNALKLADSKGIQKIALPPMGTGFYAIPLDLSAKITLKVVSDYLMGSTNLKEVVFCFNDNREYKPFQKQLTALN